MKDRLQRIAGIVHADVLIRFRRTSTLVIFLLLSALAYVWVPDPATGRTLMQIDGRRAIYNSATVGVGTASLCSLFIGLIGFYVISNAIGRDAQTRCGQVVASTPMRTSDYLLAKTAGNIAFLVTFASGFMLTAMAMQLVRGEAPLEPVTFLRQYVFMLGPVVVFVSCMAILFESIPWLSGRLGDVVYFFVFISSFGAAAASGEDSSSGFFTKCLDLSGMALLISHLKSMGRTGSVSLGASNFDPALPTVAYGGLEIPPEWILPRIITTFGPLLLVGVAAVFFHRFDPARMKRTSMPSERGWLRRFNALLKPLTRPLTAISAIPWNRPRIVRTALDEALISFSSAPILFVAALGVGLFALAGPAEQAAKMLIVAFVPAALAISNLACRESVSGTESMVYATAGRRSQYVAWKALAALITMLFFIGPAIARLASTGSLRAVAVAGGMLLICAAAILLAIVSSNPRTFVALFLIFWYVVVNDKGQTPALDIASLFSEPDPVRIALTTGLAFVLFALAHAAHRFRVSRA